MKTSIKRTLAIVFAFAIGLLLSAKVIAQESQQIQQIESTIAQLQAELDQLRSRLSASNQTTWQPSTSDPVTAPPAKRNLVAPGYDAREVMDSQVQFPTPSQTSPGVPPASLAPTLVEQPGPQIQVPQITPRTNPAVVGPEPIVTQTQPSRLGASLVFFQAEPWLAPNRLAQN